MEDDLLAGPVHDFVEEAAGRGFRSFFLRYSDPARHVRLRFRGEPERLVGELFPLVTTWATGLMRRGECARFALDTYERELERFGGPDGTTAAEAMFVADSEVVVELLHLRAGRAITLDHLAVAVLTVDALLDGFGRDGSARAEWCRARAASAKESGGDYRTWKAALRPLLARPDGQGPLAERRERLRAAAASLSVALGRLHEAGALTCSPADVLPSTTHLHLNRLLGADATTERRVYGLLGRLHAGLVASLP
jgi:thiopeptide-type bacteriocin biosynthesis protein